MNYNYDTIKNEVDNFCSYLEKQTALINPNQTAEALKYLCLKEKKSEDEKGLMAKISYSVLDWSLNALANRKEGLTFKEATEIIPAIAVLSVLADK